jgi:predicted ATPase/class 3 adenylate cyclase
VSADAPTVSVTLVFTDIEASTVLWERVPDVMRVALELHDDCMRAAISAHGGYEVRTEGDAFKVAFGSPATGVQWALDVQRRLMELPWPDGLADQPEAADVQDSGGNVLLRGLRVRMGGHTGFPEHRVHPTTGRMEYDGPMVNEAARIAAAPQGGQFLVSAISWESARRAADLSQVQCIDMGMHRLKGVREPEHLMELRAPEFSGRSFAPLRTETVRNTNLRSRGTAFVGRTEELAQVEDCFKQGARLVSLLGPGGTGKTRLATEFGLGQVDAYATDGGVWFCDLEEVVDLAGVCTHVGRELSVPMNGAGDPQGAAGLVGVALRGLSPVLVVLDNLEQIVEPGREAVRTWMNEATDARFLVTSREPLELDGERQVALTGLSPEDARKLFLDRVERVKPGFSPSPEDERAIENIVRQLDCMPLALELAASRANVLSLAAVAKRLDQRFRLLAARKDQGSRQGTLRNTIDWSWNLLDEGERTALAQCSVFSGGFSMDAAEAVLDLDATDGAPWPMDVVGALERKSLLHSRDEDGEVRLGQYRSIEAYAAERLAVLGGGDELAQRHAAYYAQEAERWSAAMDTEREIDAFRSVMLETDNLRVAYATSLENDPARACRVALALAMVLTHVGPGRWFDDMLDQAIDIARGVDDDALLARLLTQRARVHRLVARPEPARADASEAADIASAGGHHSIEADACLGLGLLHFYGVGDDEAHHAIFQRGIEASRRAKDPLLEYVIRSQVGYIEKNPDEQLTRARQVGQLKAPLRTAWLYGMAALGLSVAGRIDDARKSIKTSAALYEPFNLRLENASCHAQAAMMDIRSGIPSPDALDAATEAMRPIAAPGRHLAHRVLRAASELLEARARGDDDDAADREQQARALIEEMRAPGEPDAEHPERTRSWVERSAWTNGSVGLLEGLLDHTS